MPNCSQDFPPLLSGAPEEEEAVWSHAVGSGALLPGNIEEESSRAGVNTSAITLTATGELQCASGLFHHFMVFFSLQREESVRLMLFLRFIE